VRGAAPSIVCPRCEQEAPPQDAIAKLATCRACGLVFDAAPRDRQVPVRRRRPEPEPEPEPPEPEASPPPRRGLTPLQIAGVIVVILALALIVEGPGPREPRAVETKPEDPWLTTLLERHRLAAWVSWYGTGPCVEFSEALLREPVCSDPASELRVLGALDAIVRKPEFRAELCRITAAEIEAVLRRLRCVRP
jgi:hypothetical protein